MNPTFEALFGTPGTRRWAVMNTERVQIGTIRWSNWTKTHNFHPIAAAFGPETLRSVADFIEQIPPAEQNA